MADVISWRTVIVAITLALIGIVFNTTRLSVTGTALEVWIVGSIFSAFLLVHGIQYARLNYAQ